MNQSAIKTRFTSPNVRITEEELEDVIEHVTDIIKNSIKNKKFDQFLPLYSGVTHSEREGEQVDLDIAATFYIFADPIDGSDDEYEIQDIDIEIDTATIVGKDTENEYKVDIAEEDLNTIIDAAIEAIQAH